MFTKITLTPQQETEARESFREHCMAEYGRWPNFANIEDTKNWYQFRAGWARCVEATKAANESLQATLEQGH